MGNGDQSAPIDDNAGNSSEVPSTDLSQGSAFEQKAADIRAGQISPKGIDSDINSAIGSYLSEQTGGKANTALTDNLAETQAELEDALGSQYASTISGQLDGFANHQLQYDDAEITVTRPTAADPVDLATGQFIHSVTDFTVSGAGIDFAFVRTYKSGSFYQGPLAAGWDHSANLWIYVNLDGSLTLQTGQLRPIRFLLNSAVATASYYYVATGCEDVITQSADSSYFEQQSPDGRVVRYVNYTGDGQVFQASLIQDRFGNNLTFTYDEDDNGNFLLTVITVNNAGRTVQFGYDDQSRITSTVLFPTTYDVGTGQSVVQREWTYEYDEFCDLAAVTGPATDEFPDGRTTQYCYSSSSSFAIRLHDLLTITDPNGNTYLETAYGSSPGTVAFGKVISQQVGDGVFLFEWEEVLPDPSWTYTDTECPTTCVTVVQRNGHSVYYVLNALGCILVSVETILTDYGDAVVVWRYDYDEDGRLIATLSPEGRMTQTYYGRQYYYDKFYPGATDDQIPLPWQDSQLSLDEYACFGNVLATVQRAELFDFSALSDDLAMYGDIFPDVLAPDTTGDDIIVKYTYEPVFQQRAKVSDPRFTSSANPDAVEAATYVPHLTVTTFNINAAATPAAIAWPDTTYPSPLPDGTTGVTGARLTYDAYDRNGRLLQLTRPAGNVLTNNYFPAAVGQPTIEGFLASQTIGVGSLNLVTKFTVNEAGQVVAITDPLNNTTQFGIDPASLVRVVTPPMPGYSVTSAFDGNGQVVSRATVIVAPDGSIVPGSPDRINLAYNTEKSLVLTASGDSSGTPLRQVRLVYDAANCLIRMVQPRGNSVCYEYDERQLLTRMTRACCAPEAASTGYAYDLDGRRVAVTDPRGGVTVSDLDAFGRAVSITDPLESLIRIDYDKLNNIIVHRLFGAPVNGQSPLLRRTDYQYDERNKLNQVRQAVFNTPIGVANPWNAPDAEFNSAVTAGTVTFAISQTFYDANLRVFQLVDANGNVWTREYDDADRCTKTTDPTGSYQLATYDAAGNIVRVDRYAADSGGVVRAVLSNLFGYDGLNRLTSSTDGAGNLQAVGLDSLGLTRIVTDPLGQITNYNYNAFRDRITVTQELVLPSGGTVGLTTTLSYDPNGNVVSVTDPRGNSTYPQYDLLDRVVCVTNADGSYRTIAYDRSGNAIQLADEDGVAVSQTFDPVNNKLTMSVATSGVPPASAEQLAWFSYDGAGALIGHGNTFLTAVLSRDSLGRCYLEALTYGPMLTTGTSLFTVGRQFDAVSNLIQLAYPSGQVVSYGYDPANRLLQVDSMANAAGYPGDPGAAASRPILGKVWWGGLSVGSTFGNGVTLSTTYDAAGRRIADLCQLGNGDQFLLQQLWDGAGNRRLDIEQYKSRLRGERFDYDSTNRLMDPLRLTAPSVVATAAITPPTSPQTAAMLKAQAAIDVLVSGYAVRTPALPEYSYDDAGNRLRQNRTNYTTNTRNEYVLVGTSAYTYNKAGRLTGDPDFDYAYNMRGQLVQANSTAGGVTALQVFHDALGRPIGTIEGTVTRLLVPDGANTLEYYDNGVLAAVCIREGRDRVCFFATGGHDQYVMRDVLESTRLTSDSSGAEIGIFRYDPFGGLRAGVTATPILYSGKYLYDSLGWYEYVRRQYIPVVGRFAQPDPGGFIDGPNLYMFARNNPLSMRDPNGMTATAPGAQTETTPQLPALGETEATPLGPPPQDDPIPMQPAAPAPPAPDTAPGPVAAPPPVSAPPQAAAPPTLEDAAQQYAQSVQDYKAAAQRGDADAMKAALQASTKAIDAIKAANTRGANSLYIQNWKNYAVLNAFNLLFYVAPELLGGALDTAVAAAIPGLEEAGLATQLYVQAHLVLYKALISLTSKIVAQKLLHLPEKSVEPAKDLSNDVRKGFTGAMGEILAGMLKSGAPAVGTVLQANEAIWEQRDRLEDFENVMQPADAGK